MRLCSLFHLLLLFVCCAQAGSQLWEASHATLKRTNCALLKRAVSLKASDNDDNAGAYRWPKKTISYAYRNDEAEDKLKTIFEDAKSLWNQLIVKGFKYEKLSRSECRARRKECLLIHYNDQGVLSTTVGLRPLDEDFEGPNMHLSDKRDVGNLKELAMQHMSLDMLGVCGMSTKCQNGTDLMTGDYHCENLKDYEEALDKMAEDLGLQSREELPEIEVNKLCRLQGTAENYRFSAFDWVPSWKGGMDPDDTFDKRSLMLYPSGAGGKGDVIFGDTSDDVEDGRLPVMIFPDGKLIPTRGRPSDQDIEKLIWLYGTDYVGESRLHIDSSSRFKGLVKRIRSTMSLRAGHTAQGMC
ncbi:zinc-dependent metalloprotease [Fusarium coicis]|nr:zinc-dependent metalloprotease [Fusarium coicis]